MFAKYQVQLSRADYHAQYCHYQKYPYDYQWSNNTMHQDNLNLGTV